MNPRTDVGPLFTEDDIISVYTRAQAIEDGELVDVTHVAKEAGFKVPVAVTAHVWSDCIAWSKEDNDRKGTCQDEAGRLWDVIWMGYLAARRMGAGSDRGTYRILRVPREGPSVRAQFARLEIAIHGGDEGEPVITIMFPEDR